MHTNHSHNLSYYCWEIRKYYLRVIIFDPEGTHNTMSQVTILQQHFDPWSQVLNNIWPCRATCWQEQILYDTEKSSMSIFRCLRMPIAKMTSSPSICSVTKLLSLFHKTTFLTSIWLDSSWKNFSLCGGLQPQLGGLWPLQRREII